MTFEEDLTKRRIDVAAFATGEPDRYAEWQQMYAQMHPNSFYISVKMVLNDVRRKFWLAEAIKPATTITTEAPAKPAVRRAAIPGAVKPPVAAPASTEPTITPESKPAPPIKGRAVIRKPASTNAEENKASESVPLVAPEVKTDTPPASPPPRPRPVFRKPAPAAAPEETPAGTEQIAEDKTNHATPFHTNPDPETEAPTVKPPRPRPVIKRPANTPQTSAENAAVVPPPGPELPSEKIMEVPASAGEQVKATPPRPRPVMRRPNPPTEEKLTPAPELTTDKPAGEEPINEPIAAAKPPRPRPVFKRPSKPEDNNGQ